MEYYSATRKGNPFLQFATTLLGLEGIMMSGISQTNTVDLAYMWNLNKSNSYNLLRVVTRGWEQGGGIGRYWPKGLHLQ